MISVGIIGASGYTGEELIRLLLLHPEVSIDVLTSRTYAGKCVDDIYSFDKKLEKDFLEPVTDNLLSCDVVFFASPNGVAMNMACLLYTSPSPRDRTRSRMPSSA